MIGPSEKTRSAPEAKRIELNRTGVTLLQSGKGVGGAGTRSAEAPLAASLARQAAASSCEAGGGVGVGAGVGAGAAAHGGFVAGAEGRTGGSGGAATPGAAPRNDKAAASANVQACGPVCRFSRRD